MKEHPILFSGAMVRAILEGRKTQTRRVVKPQPWGNQYANSPAIQKAYYYDVGQTWRFTPADVDDYDPSPYCMMENRCPYGQPGDRLWLRETHAIVPRTAYLHSDGVQQVVCPDNNHDATIFRAGWARSHDGIRWRPSIHMPRWASRITLEVVDVRVERVKSITEADAIAEGAQPRSCTIAPCSCQHIHGFAELWDSINSKRGYGWASDPWVWVVTFKRVEAAHE